MFIFVLITSACAGSSEATRPQAESKEFADLIGKYVEKLVAPRK